MIKRLLIFCVFFVCGFPDLYAQEFSPDLRLSSLLKSGEYFQFREELLEKYTSINYNEPDVETPEKLYFFAWENYLFNKSALSNENIESFLGSKSFIYSDSVAAELLLLHFQNDIRLFNYKRADSVSTILLFRYASVIEPKTLADIRNTAQITSALVNVAPQTIDRKENLDIIYKRDIANLIRIPVTMNNKTEDYIFDTGANFSTISQSQAKKMGVRELNAKFSVTTSSRNALESKLGGADKMQIGNITFSNVVFIILPDKALKFAGGIYKIKGIVGLPVIAQMQEIEITKDNHFKSSASSFKPHAVNLGLEGNTPFLNVTFFGDDRLYIFDTGAGATIVGNRFYETYKDSLGNADEGSARVGGAGGIEKINMRTVKNVHYTLGGAKNVLKSMSIQLSGVTDLLANYYGIAGQDIFMQWKVMTINFDGMYVELE